ncbi:type IX secretion system sortase PorU [Spirosoma sp. KUDC1026]|uniref:type IX secretion system sortase PorU n=1 Tax=Spirosoma sp. KUDC1026 TaxID=2745947 RepID=UPI00159BD7CB|nr:type IX secretion system sortase PorU [Spirosoma sp. KUDC1026]QKZ11961.1 type IX secretion system sortase PorU [Spirosoma sp. KUDC1026]
MHGWKKAACSLWLILLIISSLPGWSQTVTNSVLREGVWVKIGVTTSGIYRLDQPTLSSINAAFAGADPRQLRLYGNGGAMLPQANDTPRASDLTENAIQVTGEADGRFDAGDAIVFYGQSPHTIHYDTLNRRFTHQKNVYSDTTFYFLTIGASAGLRVSTQAVSTLLKGSSADTAVISSFEDYQFHEKDALKISYVHSGREWLGEDLSIDTLTAINFSVPGMAAGATVRLGASVVARATETTLFRLRSNRQEVGVLDMGVISGYEYDYQGVARTDTFVTKSAAADALPLTVGYQKNRLTAAQGYLNYLSVQVRRELRQYGQATCVRRLPAGQYAVRQATTGLRVWDVTNPLIPSVQSYSLTAGEASWTAKRQGDYFLFTDAQMQTPASVKTIAVQNVHGQSTPDLLIVAPAAWQAQAERLAAYRREHDKLSVLVVTTQQVFNEFGSGQADPTAIRDAARYFYNQSPGKLQYLLLFGDATYDYRNIAGMNTATDLANMVPVYESRESLHPVLSYSSDDYFGFMQPSQGEWWEDYSNDHRMDIGVGRLPVKSIDEAKTVVDKLIRYGSDQTLLGDWQTKVMVVADDGDYNLHQQDANELAKLIETTDPAYRPERIFLDNYVQETTSLGQRVPAVNQLISQSMVDGRLIINYSGHGGVSTLADEQIVTLQDILNWRNKRLPLLVTATCQFGRYDDPNANSGAELALLSRLGGAIALLSTTRPVYANSNLLINKAFYKAVFTPVNGTMPRLGDVMRVTKNASLSGPLNRNFTLLGDPSMRLAYPEASVALTKVNSHTLAAGQLDTLRAQQTVELAGEIRLGTERMTSFSGTIQLSLFDKKTTRTTLGTEASSPRMSYEEYANPIFTGRIAVQQGQFVLKFIMPKDINYTVGQAKLQSYAIQSDSLMTAIGSYENLRIGGSIVTDSLDNQPPTVTMNVLNGTRQGEEVQAVGPAVTLLVDLQDNRGINIARSGLGHELTIQLEGQSPVILNDLYVATGNDGRQGQVRYTFQNVLPGTYRVRVKAWDINNNSTEAALSIVVSERPRLHVQRLWAMPNPVVTQTTLTADLNRTGEALDWTTSVYDLNGLLVTQQTGQCTDCPAAVEVGSWDGRSSIGSSVPVGTYIMRLQIRSASDGSTATSSGRLLLTR